jgi:hypothetical protein
VCRTEATHNGCRDGACIASVVAQSCLHGMWRSRAYTELSTQIGAVQGSLSGHSRPSSMSATPSLRRTSVRDAVMDHDRRTQDGTATVERVRDRLVKKEPSTWCGRSRDVYRDIEAFIETLSDEDRADRLFIAISGRGAFRFKDVLARWPGELEVMVSCIRRFRSQCYLNRSASAVSLATYAGQSYPSGTLLFSRCQPIASSCCSRMMSA